MTRQCVMCGVSFEKDYDRQRTCSKRCRRSYLNGKPIGTNQVLRRVPARKRVPVEYDVEAQREFQEECRKTTFETDRFGYAVGSLEEMVENSRKERLEYFRKNVIKINDKIYHLNGANNETVKNGIRALIRLRDYNRTRKNQRMRRAT